MNNFNSRLVVGLGLTFLLITFAAASAQNPREPFQPGETLTFDLMWTVFRAGEVTSTLRSISEPNHAAYQVTATARSEGFVNLLYDVNDDFRATSNAQTLCSEGIVKKVNEGHRHR